MENLEEMSHDLQSGWFFVFFFFLLQIEVESKQTLQNTSDTVKYLNNLYKIILKPMTWFDALRECQKDNMHLVSITDPYQQAFLTVQGVLHNSSLWIGLSSQDVSFQSQMPRLGDGMWNFCFTQHFSYQTERTCRLSGLTYSYLTVSKFHGVCHF